MCVPSKGGTPYCRGRPAWGCRLAGLMAVCLHCRIRWREKVPPCSPSPRLRQSLCEGDDYEHSVAAARPLHRTPLEALALARHLLERVLPPALGCAWAIKARLLLIGGGGQGGFLVRSLVGGAGSYSVAHRAGLLPTELTGMWGWILLRSPHQGRGSSPGPAPTKQRQQEGAGG